MYIPFNMLGNIFSRQHFEIFFLLFFLENRLEHFIQTICMKCHRLFGDNLHEMSKPVFWKKERKISSIGRLLNQLKG